MGQSEAEWTTRPMWMSQLARFPRWLSHRLGQRLPPDVRVQQKEEVLARQIRVHGEDSSIATNAQGELATALEGVDRYEEACQIRREIVARCRVRLGPDHWVTLTNEMYLASNLAVTRNLRESRQLVAHVVQARRRTLGPSNGETRIAKKALESLDTALPNQLPKKRTSATGGVRYVRSTPSAQDHDHHGDSDRNSDDA
jgi:Tetratricopeptide repeat